MSSTLTPSRSRRAQRPMGRATQAGTGAVPALPDIAQPDVAQPDIAMIGHELRTPLTAIRGALGLIQSGTLGALPEQAARMIEIARDNSQRLLQLIDDLLTVEAFGAGAIGLRLVQLDLVELLQQAITANAGLVAEQGGAFVLRETLSAAIVRGDPARLSQVLANLMSNAAKFAPGTIVSLSLRHHGLGHDKGYRITVADQGPGIPPAFRARIFQRFARASETATHTPGSGLGLSIGACQLSTARFDRRSLGLIV